MSCLHTEQSNGDRSRGAGFGSQWDWAGLHLPRGGSLAVPLPSGGLQCSQPTWPRTTQDLLAKASRLMG